MESQQTLTREHNSLVGCYILLNCNFANYAAFRCRCHELLIAHFVDKLSTEVNNELKDKKDYWF